jgi:hypothetical protein
MGNAMKKMKISTTDYAVFGALALGAYWWWHKGQAPAATAPIAAPLPAPISTGPVAQILNTNTGVPTSATNTPVPDIGNGFDPSTPSGDDSNSAANAVILAGG